MDNQPKMPLPPPTHKEKLKTWLHQRKFSERWERWHPRGVGLSIFIAALFAPTTRPQFLDLLKDVVPQTVSVAAILAGFQGAMHAILLSMREWRVVKQLERDGLYIQLIHYVKSGVVSLVMFVAFALGVLTLNALAICPQWPRLITATLLGLFSYALLASLRIMLLLVKMLHIPKGEND